MIRRILAALLLAAVAGNGLATDLHFVTEEFRPFSFASSRVKTAAGLPQADGAMADIVRAVCERLHYRCTIEVHPWRRALALGENGEVDGLFTVIRSPARERAFFITPMLATSRYDIYALADSGFVYRSPADMSRRTVGVYGPSGTSYILGEHLQAVPDVDVQLVTDNQRLLRMLNVGRFGADGLVVLNRDVARHLIEKEKLVRIRKVGHLESVSYAIGLSRKRVSEARFKAFSGGVSAAIADGTVATILQRYGLQPAEPEPSHAPSAQR